MAIWDGHMYIEENISLRGPSLEAVRTIPEEWAYWLVQACERDDLLYFSIYKDDRLAGAIFLHDIDRQVKEALVGYHLFQTQDRGQGTGTTALRLLQQFVVEQTNLATLVIITSQDNLASQQIAQKCNFMYTGTAREGPRLVVFEWRPMSRAEVL